jgi:hypothetical protein
MSDEEESKIVNVYLRGGQTIEARLTKADAETLFGIVATGEVDKVAQFKDRKTDYGHAIRAGAIDGVTLIPDDPIGD